jgi:hypothetical protein
MRGTSGMRQVTRIGQPGNCVGVLVPPRLAFQVASVRVVEATNLGMEFIRSTNGLEAMAV